jgi:hypothetical protein
MQDFGKLVPSKRRHQSVDVVCRDYEVEQQISLAVKESQSRFHNCGIVGIAKWAFAVPRIQPVLNASWKSAIKVSAACPIVRRRMLFYPHIEM